MGARWLAEIRGARGLVSRLDRPLEGFDGDVFYIGSDDTYSYFRIGRVFRSYYKVPTCAAKLPQTLPIDSGPFYAVRLHMQADNTIRVTKGCSS